MAAIVLGSVPVVKRIVRPGELVVEVVDGDTFIIQNRQPIRLYGVDAPAVEDCMGTEARQTLKKKILGKRVVIKEPLSDGRGRIMALVYLKKELVNETLVKNGLAMYRRQAGTEKEAMKAANEYARNKGAGIYGPECYQKEPPDTGCAIKGNLEGDRGEKIYYAPSCPYYVQVIVEKFMGEKWFCSEKEARESGFTRSSDCLGSERD